LTQEEIDRLVKDAQLNASEDQKKRELVEAKNAADALIYSVEKSLDELGQQLDTQSRGQAESSVAELKQAMQTEDSLRIRQLTENLSHIAHAMSQAAYRQPHSNAQGRGHQQSGHRPAQDDDVVDADFEEVA
jgi:molecular chaperone DnaK